MNGISHKEFETVLGQNININLGNPITITPTTTDTKYIGKSR